MNIGEAARHTGLPSKTIRYYEDVGLIRPPRRRANGYRTYADRDLHLMRFVQRARSLGFAVEDCRELVTLYEDTRRASADVKALALARVDEIDRKLEELAGLRDALAELAEKCHGDERPDCPILDDLAGESR